MKPLLKWAGGKQWLAPALIELFQLGDSRRIIEPFAGGASLFFGIETSRAVLSDINVHLIATYKTLKANAAATADRLQDLKISKDTYYRLRASAPTDPVEAACRVIYLNRTAFGGIWRVNRHGQFNVPFGCKPETKLPNPNTLIAYGRALRRASLMSGDFETCLEKAGTNDFVYCDPPYTVSHNNNGFLRYNERIFSWQDQQRLAAICNKLALNGRNVVVSNAAHGEVMALYDDDAFQAFALARPSNLAAKSAHRTTQDELLLVSKNCGSSNTIERLLCRPSYPAKKLQLGS